MKMNNKPRKMTISFTIDIIMSIMLTKSLVQLHINSILSSNVKKNNENYRLRKNNEVVNL